MMKALEEEAAVCYWWPVGARTDRQHELIRDCAWWLVALATLNLGLVKGPVGTSEGLARRAHKMGAQG